MMKLAASNIAWSSENDSRVYRRMQELGFSGLEIAPTRIFPANPYEHLKEASEFANLMRRKYSLEICSMQSIWYGMPQRISGTPEERQELFAYTQKAIAFADALGCRNLVFGCPRNRSVNKPEDADVISQFLMDVAEQAKILTGGGVLISLEPNPAIYNTNFINTTQQALELLRKINHPSLKLNLDIGTIIQNGESIDEIFTGSNSELINHVHISEPNLAPVKSRPVHKEIIDRLKHKGYKNFLSIEMAKTEDLSGMFEAMSYLKQLTCTPQES